MVPMDVDVEHTSSSQLMDQTRKFDMWSELSLPECATDGCTQPVHCDNRLPMDVCMFKYCNPQCRDKDLLDRSKVALKSDIKKLEEEYISVRTLPITSSSTSKKASKSAMSSSKMTEASEHPGKYSS